MTLHEAIEKVLKESGRPMSAAEIADVVNKQGLYSRGDKNPVPSSQIHARVKNYPSWFSRTEAGLISLVIERQDQFSDAVFQVLNILKSTFLPDISYLIAALFFYKRWIDYSSMLIQHKIEIEIDRKDCMNSEAFRSFYRQLKEKLAERKKNFDIELIEDLFSYNHDLFSEDAKAFDYALKALDKYTFSESAYSVNNFGKRFSELFTRSYANIKETGEYATPESLSELLTSLVDIRPDDLIYNPAAGYFTFLAALQRKSEFRIRFFGEELNNRVYSLGLLNLIANGASIEYANQGDSLTSSEIQDESADVVISNPPFNITSGYSRYDKLYPFKSKNGNLYFLQLALKKLKQGGEVIIVLPEHMLFAGGPGILQFRKYLIECNLVDTVISLPSGTFEPYSMVKTSILILKKDRPLDKIMFFDADRSDYYSKDKKNRIILKTALISEQVKKLKDTNKKINIPGSVFSSENLMLQEGAVEYGNVEKSYVFSTLDEVRSNEFSLDVKRYFLSNLSNIVLEDGTERIVELQSILKLYRNKSMLSAEAGLPYLSITNLNADFTKFRLGNYEQLKINPGFRGHIADTDLLMVGSIGARLKPSYFKFEGQKLLISSDVYTFTTDQLKIDPEYIVYELSAEYVAEQVNVFTRGITIKRISVDDFLKIKIRLPDSIEEQKEIVKRKKEALVKVQLKEADDLAERLKVSASDERKVLGALKHELTPLASIMTGSLSTLNRYLSEKINKNDFLQWGEKVSGAPQSRTLEELMSDMQKISGDLLALSESIQNIINVGKEELQFENAHILHFIKDQVNKWPLKDSYNIAFNPENPENPDVKIQINKEQFSILIRNFLENTHKHGYPDQKMSKYDCSLSDVPPARNIVINILRQEDSVIIDLINDGEPFPHDFSFNNYISFGDRSGSAKGPGIGGYLMNRIVENHNGQFKMLESGSSLIIPAFHKKQTPGSIRIITGVFFRIILPTNNTE